MPKMTPSEAFVETLVAHGVKHVFGIVGSAYMDALDLFPAAGIRFIPTAHEQGAGHMADGYARVSGRQGVCIAQNGPGVTNFVTSTAAAFWAHSPVVVITPESGSMGMGLGGFQETDQLPIFSKITKFQGHVNNPARMAEMTGRCFDMAMAERGPTQLNIPRDYFYGEITCEIPQPQRVARGAGAEESLDEAADLLAKAKFPVIVAGGGIIMSGGSEEAKELAEFLQAPVVNSYLHNDSFPADHPLWCGPLGYQGSKAAMKIIAQADVVLALGHAARALRHAAAARSRLLAQEGEDHPDRQRPPHAGPRQADLGRHLRRCQGLRPRPQPPPRQPRRGRAQNRAGAPRDAEGGEGGLGEGARRLDARDGRLVARGRQGRRPHASAPDAARAGEGHAARAPWSPPTSATSARCRTATCASASPTPCSPP